MDVSLEDRLEQSTFQHLGRFSSFGQNSATSSRKTKKAFLKPSEVIIPITQASSDRSVTFSLSNHGNGMF